MAQTSFERGRRKIYSAKSLVDFPQKKVLSHSPLKRLPEIQKTVIYVPLCEASREVGLYQWRTQTELPVVKVSHFSERACPGGSCEFEVYVENHPIRLPDLSDLPLFKVLYLLKEALIGFERLFQKFGAFLPSPRMIALDRAGCCRVWLSEDFASNRTTVCNANQTVLLHSVCQLLEKVANRHLATQTFFGELRSKATFCSALAFISSYAKAKMITVPTFCKIVVEIGKAQFNAFLTMNNAPKFLSSLRTSLRSASRNGQILLPQASINQREDEEDANESNNGFKVVSSENTTAELPSINESGLQAEDQFLFENLLDLNNPLSSEPLIRSQHQPFQQSNCFRKLSDQFFSIKCLASRPPTRSPSKQSPIGRKWAENDFVSCEGEGMKQWQGLKGLFEGRSELKKSIHSGRQQREEYNFELLGNFGKAIRESQIHQQMESYQY